jgi:hypothetical protein
VNTEPESQSRPKTKSWCAEKDSADLKTDSWAIVKVGEDQTSGGELSSAVTNIQAFMFWITIMTDSEPITVFYAVTIYGHNYTRFLVS